MKNALFTGSLVVVATLIGFQQTQIGQIRQELKLNTDSNRASPNPLVEPLVSSYKAGELGEDRLLGVAQPEQRSTRAEPGIERSNLAQRNSFIAIDDLPKYSDTSLEAKSIGRYISVYDISAYEDNTIEPRNIGIVLIPPAPDT